MKIIASPLKKFLKNQKGLVQTHFKNRNALRLKRIWQINQIVCKLFRAEFKEKDIKKMQNFYFSNITQILKLSQNPFLKIRCYARASCTALYRDKVVYVLLCKFNKRLSSLNYILEFLLFNC